MAIRRAVRKLTRAGTLVFSDHSSDENSVFLLSSGRSGSTWLGDILQTLPGTRVIFEPMQPRFGVKTLSEARYRYVDPESRHDALLQGLREVMEGRQRSTWTEQFNPILRFRYSRRLVKEVRANLLLPWLTRNFDGCRFILLLRHPAAVVSSQIRRWHLSSRRLRDQPALARHIDLDRFARFGWPDKGYESNMIFWAIENRIALEHAAQANVHVVFYEDLCLRPSEELTRLGRYLGVKFPDSTEDVLGRSSWSSRSTVGDLAPEAKIAQWQDRVTQGQLDETALILEAAGLDKLYGDGFHPDHSAIARMFS